MVIFAYSPKNTYGTMDSQNKQGKPNTARGKVENMYMIGKETKRKQTENTLYKMTTVGSNALVCRQVYGFEQETIFSGTIEEANNFWKTTVENK